MVEEGDFDEEDLPDWQRELIPKVREILEDESWIALPNKFDLHEWEIMRKFADHVDNARLAERLHRAIRGSGAFRMFKDVVYDAGVHEDWYRFKHQALREIARDALEEAGIPCR